MNSAPVRTGGCALLLRKIASSEESEGELGRRQVATLLMESYFEVSGRSHDCGAWVALPRLEMDLDSVMGSEIHSVWLGYPRQFFSVLAPLTVNKGPIEHCF